LVIYCNASLTSLGFVIPSHKLGFTGVIPLDGKLPTIIYYESLVIMSVVLWASGITTAIHQFLIYMDSLNCIEMFNSLCVLDGYNDILLFTVHTLIVMYISL